MTIRSVSSRADVTRSQLVDDFRALGVEPGHTLLVHSARRSLGWVEGGAGTVVSALRESVGSAGNVVTMTGTELNSSTSRAHKTEVAGMTPKQRRAYYEAMPPFDPDRTPSGMGAVSEALRTSEGAVRSDHPQSSFAALGPDARDLMADHRLECHLGEESPLAKLDRIGAQVLLIGVSYKVCTAFHLAEYRYQPCPPTKTYECVVTGANGQGEWVTYQDVVLDDGDFEVIGNFLEADRRVLKGKVADARGRMFPMSVAVSTATEWLSMTRR